MEADLSGRSAKANYHFLTSAVCPRPIAWVTTVGDGVVNAAPFSWFQAVCADPPLLMLSLSDRVDGTPKDSLRNILESREFVVNVAVREAADQVVACSGEYPPEVSETDVLGLATAPSKTVAPPRLADAPVHMECVLEATHRYGAASPVTLVIGRVVHVHAQDGVLDARGNVDPTKVRFLARLGGPHYTSVDHVFDVPRPKQEDLLRKDG